MIGTNGFRVSLSGPISFSSKTKMAPCEGHLGRATA